MKANIYITKIYADNGSVIAKIASYGGNKNTARNVALEDRSETRLATHDDIVDFIVENGRDAILGDNGKADRNQPVLTGIPDVDDDGYVQTAAQEAGDTVE